MSCPLLELRASHRNLRCAAFGAQQNRTRLGLAEALFDFLGLLPKVLNKVSVFEDRVTAQLFCRALREVLEQNSVPVGPTQLVVAPHRNGVDRIIRKLNHGDIKGAAAEVIHQQSALTWLSSNTVGNSCGDRLGHDPYDIQTCDFARLSRCSLL